MLIITTIPSNMSAYPCAVVKNASSTPIKVNATLSSIIPAITTLNQSIASNFFLFFITCMIPTSSKMNKDNTIGKNIGFTYEV